MMIGYLQDSVRYLGEKAACRMMRSRLCWFVKGMRNAGQFRNASVLSLQKRRPRN
jgi:tRNA-dihydrouridine synthase B